MLRTLSIITAVAFATACTPEAEIAAPDEVPAAEDASAEATLLLPLPDATVPAITADDIAIRIKTLADDAFEGRAPASEKGEKAADWIAAEMQRLGLQPGGDNGTWFQTVEMIEQSLDEAASSLTFTGGASGEPYPMTLRENAVLWTKQQTISSLEFNDSELVFVGYGVVAPEYGWNDYDGLDASGKTVVMLVNDPGYARQGELFNGEAMTYYGRWTYKFEEAARQGATGAIVIHETAPASYGWEVVSNGWTGPQADLVRNDGGESRTQYESWIDEETARALFAEAGLDFSDMKRAAKGIGFEPVKMGELKANGKVVQTVSSTQSRNVLGVLPGKTAPDEYMLFTAHWDHLGKKTEEKSGEPGQDFYRDEIFNGAVDNATGTASMLEIAEALAADELDRSVLFLAVTLEESGLLGSAYYAENPSVPMNKIVAGINIDAMQPVGKTKDMVIIGYGASELESRLETYLNAKDRIVLPDQNPQAGSFYRSDQMSFTRKGVPMLYADNGLDKIDGGVAAGRAFAETYNAQRYHKPMDEYNEDWDLTGMADDITALYTVARDIAQSSDWPTWYPGNEFEAIRQASLSESD